MKPNNSGSRNRRLWLGGGIATALTVLVGAAFFFSPFGGSLTRVSYDLPFALRAELPANEVALVYLDEASHQELKQPLAAPWDRSLHARLIERLTAAGAKAIVFDILFAGPSGDATADAKLAEAIRQSQRVILGGNFNQRETTPGAAARWEELPHEPFLSASAGWGNVNLFPDPDYGVRLFFPKLGNLSGQTNIAWLPWAVASLVGAESTQPDNAPSRAQWINYLGPPGTLASVSYFLALQPDGVPPGFFKDKIVFVGGLLSADFSGKGKDEFRTPYTYWGKGFAPGVEIHATAALNLIHGNWLTRLWFPLEFALVLLVAFGAGLGLMRVRALPATLLALAGVLVVVVAAHWLVWHQHVWFAWLILVLEILVAHLCSIIFNSIQLYVERRLLEQSLAAHLSPKIVKRLLRDPELRHLGGHEQDVSILFSDIANFTRISETMHPDDLVRMMNKYFETALECIHETDGTVVKLIGDAIFAIWNAPVEQSDHRERACRSALRLRQRIVEFQFAHLSLPLRTRVSLHSGIACVGNIGSRARFDYTALGDSINLTSRLEGLNKYIGTSVLATRDVQRALENALVWRPVGHFQLKGFARAVEVYELIGPLEEAERSRAWRESFAEALRDFSQRRFDSAAAKFQKTIEGRRGLEPELAVGTTILTADGPSRFYLEKIEELRARPPAHEWIGEVEVKEK